MLLSANFDHAFAQNEVTWSAIEMKDSTTVTRDLKGETNWKTIGEGDSALLVYQFKMILEQYGSDLPDKVGVVWAMP